jgi:murein DD-endopeptidase MepM/ murein hydrolase activator NlpD
MVTVTGSRSAREVEGTVGDRPLLFFPYGEAHVALAGIDLESAPGKTVWRVSAIDGAGVRRDRSGSVVVRAGRFPVERLSLPKGMVDLDPATERRAEAEAARLRALYATWTPERLWQGRFAPPVAGDGKWTGFGARRIINGQPRMPHSGADYAAGLGTAVVASNSGRVAMVGDFFFAGRLIVLDHGLGLYTLYFHLDRIDVAEGAVVERGQPIGTVGATGRVTGPHLHWGAVLRQARVDPSGLLSLGAGD